MQYNVAQLLKEPIGSTRTYPLEETFDGAQRITDRVKGQLQLLHTHQGILVTAQLDITVTLTCGRCLNPLTRSSIITIEEEYFPTVDITTGRNLPLPESAEGALRIDSHHILDFTEALRQCVITDEPMKPLCQEDCRGLCQICGTNQNYGKCNCEPQQIAPRWRVLVALLNQPD
jgi:uncharacterized protein